MNVNFIKLIFYYLYLNHVLMMLTYYFLEFSQSEYARILINAIFILIITINV